MSNGLWQLQRDAPAYFEYQKALVRYSRALVKAYKFKVGDVICSKRGWVAKVTRVHVAHNEDGLRVYMRGLVRFEDGSWSDRERPLTQDVWRDAEVISGE